MTQNDLINKDDTLDGAKRKHDLIVVASLLEKLPNLGGLTRTCEVFGASAMTIHDLRMIENFEYQTLAVTAQYWLPIVQVERWNLIQYLKEMRSKHYQIIGLEQTTNSLPLNEFVFHPDKKTILIIGKERSGIPPEIINFVDICVEIPQFGVIRSLNAHVSASITIWEYVKQMNKNVQKS
ncbi:hypothetical protein RFI_06838 [Reticulomyxa filosa]|uniref:tRNA/rRNA methyltransferase SpoU type domain-containing protein n=1 Tax=Reticulomyxa filosa TaxID=46433 RepID=X6NWM5_RETFI|nr:hypothetical protein RFI_06838 [Reticulomyxa filosa]|eukprot:ETO30283.1 hypothetical protein RFI_06838 [Reticulomyxa filosa]